MAINLSSFIVLTVGTTPITILPAGSYTLQELNVLISAVQVTTANTVFEFAGTFSSGGNVFHTVDLVGVPAANSWQASQVNQGKIFPNGLILPPNTSVIFTPTLGTNLNPTNTAALVVNISGSKR